MKDIFCKLLILLFFLLTVNFSIAISANSAVNYITSQNQFLYQEEKYEMPNIKIINQNKKYWVIPITLNDEITTLFAIEENTGELSTNKGINRELFRTAVLIRNYLKIKKNISEKQRVWIIASEYARKFSGLSTMLQDEVNDLIIIKTEVNKAEIKEKIEEMNYYLIEMSTKCSNISKKIEEAQYFESELLAQPNTSQYEEIRNKFRDIFDRIDELDEMAKKYRNEVIQLKQMISVENSLSLEKKNLLINYASYPPDFENIGSYATASDVIKDNIETLYANVLKNIDSYLNEFEERLKRNECYKILYEENQTLKKETDGKIITLKEAKNNIIDYDRMYGWKETEAVSETIRYFGLAEAEYNKRNYAKCQDYANEAIRKAIAVYRGGLIEKEEKPIINQDTAVKIIIVLVVFLIILYVVQNRKKIIDLISGGSDKEESIEF